MLAQTLIKARSIVQSIRGGRDDLRNIYNTRKKLVPTKPQS